MKKNAIVIVCAIIIMAATIIAFIVVKNEANKYYEPTEELK